MRAHGINVGDWNTIAARACSCMTTRPAVGATSPAIIRNSVVFPHPDGPSNATKSPARTARSIGATACVPVGYVLLACSTEMTVPVAVRA